MELVESPAKPSPTDTSLRKVSLPNFRALNTALERTSNNALNSCGSEWALLSPGERGQRAVIIGARNPASISILSDRYDAVDVWQLDRELAANLNKHLLILKVDVKAQNLGTNKIIEQLALRPQYYDLVVVDGCLYDMFGRNASKLKPFFIAIQTSLTPVGQCCVVAETQRSIAGISFDRTKKYLHPLSYFHRALTGFAVTRTYFLYPEIDEPEEIIGWSNALPASRSNVVTRALDSMGLIAPVHRAVTIFSGHQSYTPFLQRMLEDAYRKMGNPRAPSVKRCITRYNGTVIAMVGISPPADGDLCPAVLRIPLNLTSDARLQKAWHGLTAMCVELPWLKLLTPTPLAHSEFLGMKYYLESQCTGILAQELVKTPTAREQTHEIVLSFLHKLGTLDNPAKRFSANDMTTQITPYFTPLREYAPECEADLDHVFGLIQDRLLGSVVPLVRVHGDFNSGNVLCDRATHEITGLIDWDSCQPEGLPLQDLVHFLMHRYRHERQISMGEALLSAISGELFNASEQKLIQRYLKLFGIDEELMVPLLILYWLRHVGLHIVHRNGPLPALWQEMNIHLPLRHLSQLKL